MTSNTTIACIVLGIALFSLFIFINLPFLLPLTLAGIFALGVHDLVERTTARTKLPRTLNVWIILMLGLTFFWGPITLAVYRVTFHISNQQQNFQSEALLGQLLSLKTFILKYLQQASDWLGTDLVSPARDVLEKIINTGGNILLNFSSNVLAELPTLTMASLVFVVSLFAFTLKSKKIKDFALKYSPLSEHVTQRLIQISKESCAITLFSTFVIGLIQACLIGVGSLVFGEGDFWLVVTITFFVSFIPVIGAAPVGYLLAILAFTHDRIGPGIGLMVVATLAGTIDNVLRPLMVGTKESNSAIMAFTSVVGAVIMFGIPGLLLGPVIMNLFTGLTPVLLDEIREAQH